MADARLMPCSARTLAGLEPSLAGELAGFGAVGVTERPRAVTFRADARTLARIVAGSRLALRVHRVLYRERIRGAEDLYEAVASWDWNRWISPDQTLAVDAIVHGNRAFDNTHFVALKTKDAIVDRVRMKRGRRPSVDLRRPDLRVQVRIGGPELEVAVDASGEALHRRGYRSASVAAPLNEVLAAGLLDLAGYDGQTPFADPCCGSGTIAIEAACLATRRAPVLLRQEDPALLRWPDADPAAWMDVVQEARDAVRPSPVPIQAGDVHPAALSATRENALMAGVEPALTLRRERFQDALPPSAEGVLVTNPPYGERLQPEDIERLYAAFGDALKQHWGGWRAWLFSANIDALKRVGLKPARRIPLRNANLEARLYGFELYTGSRKGTEG